MVVLSAKTSAAAAVGCTTIRCFFLVVVAAARWLLSLPWSSPLSPPDRNRLRFFCGDTGEIALVAAVVATTVAIDGIGDAASTNRVEEAVGGGEWKLRAVEEEGINNDDDDGEDDGEDDSGTGRGSNGGGPGSASSLADTATTAPLAGPATVVAAATAASCPAFICLYEERPNGKSQ